MESASLSEALFKTQSLIKSFFSQAGASPSGEALDGLFSTLLSSGGAKSADALGCGSVSADGTANFSTGTANGKWTQTLADLKTTLNKASALLKQRASAAREQAADTQARKSLTQKNAPQGQTAQQHAEKAAQTESNTPVMPLPKSAADGATRVDGALAVAAGEGAQTEDAELSEILAALLALIQLVMQALLQMKQTGAGVESSELSEMPTLLDGAEGTDVLGDEGDSAVESTSVLGLLKAVEKNLQSMMGGDKAEGAEADTKPALADALEQLAQLDSKMEEVVSLLHSAQGAEMSSAMKAALTVPARDATGARNAALLAANGNESATTAPIAASAGTVILNPLGNPSADVDQGAGGKSFSFGGNTASFGANAPAEGAQATGTYSFASTLSAFRAVNGGAVGLPSVVDQVVIHLNRGVKDGQSHVTVHLQPGDLGKITVKLDFDADGKVQGTVTADNPKTLEMLQKDSRSLERALQDAGLRADPGSLQFNLGQGEQNHAEHGDKFADYAANGALPIENDGSGVDLVDLTALAETYYLTPTGVNIRV